LLRLRCFAFVSDASHLTDPLRAGNPRLTEILKKCVAQALR
jgi:hypothetical protein